MFVNKLFPVPTESWNFVWSTRISHSVFTINEFATFSLLIEFNDPLKIFSVHLLLYRRPELLFAKKVFIMNYWNVFRDKQVPSSSKETRTRPKINSRILHNKWASFQWWSSWQRTRHALEIVDSLGIWFIGSAHFSLTVTPRSIIIYVTDWNNFADNLSLSFPSPPPFVNNIPQQPIYSNNPSQQRSTALFYGNINFP